MITTNERFENFIEDGDDRFSEIELRVLDLEKDISDWRAARTRSVTDPARRRTRERGAAGPGYRREPEPDLAEPDYQPEFAEHGVSWEAGEPEPGWEAGWEADEPEPEPAPAFRGRGAPRHREFLRATGNPAPGRDHDRIPAGQLRSGRPAGPTRPVLEEEWLEPADRTQELITRGRQTARPRTVRRPAAKPKAARQKTARRGRWRRRRAIAVGSAAGLAVLGIGAMIILRPGPSWPASVGTVRGEITTACQNPNIASEPSQVNFACDQGHPPDPVGFLAADERQ